MHQTSEKFHTYSDQTTLFSGEEAYRVLLLGQAELRNKDLEKGLNLFEASIALKPDDPKLYFEQGLSLFDLGTEKGFEKNLLKANKKFKSAIQLFPDYFEAWLLWGLSLAHLGKTEKAIHYYMEAEEKLLKALKLEKSAEPEHLYDLHFAYGIVKSALAKHSGEAVDWQLAISSFDTASTKKNSKDTNFWNKFGSASLELAYLVSDVKLCVKAIHCFKCAITIEERSATSWKNLTKAMEFLYDKTHDEDHYTQTNECFSTAIQMGPLDPLTWLAWGKFLLKSGKITEDTKKLRLSIEKCMRATTLDSSLAKAYGCLGETLALLGEYTENLELIHEGQAKATEGLQLDPKDPELFLFLGQATNSLGRYFGEIDYHYQAIEQFQAGLSINRSSHPLWHAIGLTYAQIGNLLQDIESFKNALYFYKKAVDLCSTVGMYFFDKAYCLSKLGELTQEEHLLENAIAYFEKALIIQKNAVYLHPEWLFEYGRTLDLYGEFFDEESHYLKAVEIFSHVLMIDPDFPKIHYHLALVYSHLGELKEDVDCFYRALHFFKLAGKHDDENDQILVDVGVILINIAQYTNDESERESCYIDAESKLLLAARAGNLQSYYQLACLFALQGHLDKSISFLLKASEYDALPYADDLLQDEWLSPIRHLEVFENLLSKLEAKESLQEDL